MLKVGKFPTYNIVCICNFTLGILLEIILFITTFNFWKSFLETFFEVKPSKFIQKCK